MKNGNHKTRSPRNPARLTVFGLAAKAYDQLRDIHAVIWKCQFG
jgi:hypothetical protein